MVLLFLVLSAAPPAPSPFKVEQRARASITILRSHQASPQTWTPASRPDQREILKKEPDGEEVRLRLTEFQ